MHTALRPAEAMPRFIATLSLSLLLSAALLASAQAQQTALSFTPNAIGIEDNASDTGTASYSLGFQFTTVSAIQVTALGFFNDPSFDPANPFNSVTLNPAPNGIYTFADSHAVGIYALGGTTPLLSGTVTSSSTANGGFLYTSALTGSLVLGPGTYVIAGVTGGTDPYVYGVQTADGIGYGFTTGSGTSYGQDQYAVSSVLTNPNSTDPTSEPGFFGPNFQYQPVPEAPTTVSLGLLLALGGLIIAVRRTKSTHRI